MMDALDRYVATARTLAEGQGLTWNPPHGFIGDIAPSERWNLNALAGLPPGRTGLMRDFGWNADDLFILYDLQRERGASFVFRPSMAAEWCDLYQATLISTILIDRHTPDAASRHARAVKMLAMCSIGTHPADVTGDQVQLAYNVAIRVGGGSPAKDYVGMIRTIFDGLHLAVRPNLYSQCKAYAGEGSQAAERNFTEFKARNKVSQNGAGRRILGELQERKDAMRLPDTRAFWELCRIAFTEEPQSLLDLELFASARVHVITGLRSMEVCHIPLDWERWREWTDLDGRPAGERGGISKSLAIRYFALKQARDEAQDGIVLTARTQPVPAIFEETMVETLHEVERVTRPMRDASRRRHETARFFPDKEPSSLMPAWETYVRLVGEVQVSTTPIPDEMVSRHVRGTLGSKNGAPRFDPTFIEAMLSQQMAALASPAYAKSRRSDRQQQLATNLHGNVLCFLRGSSDNGLLRPRDVSGNPSVVSCSTRTGTPPTSSCPTSRKHWHVPGTPAGYPIWCPSSAPADPHDFLFLKAKWTRNSPLIDTTRYFAFGRFTADLQKNVGDLHDNRNRTLFARYGRTDEDRRLTINTHDLRHLQNTELFRMGVSDAIITKRFNRTSVAQSHVYDHRSLREHLDGIALPEEIEASLGPRVTFTYKLVVSERVSGPLVDAFRRVQREEGDDAAFRYLAVEADGLHTTPYGFCVNAFTVDTCPKHIECYNGCRHLARTDLPDEQLGLEKLRDRMAAVVAKVEAEPTNRVGRANQLSHARTRLKNIEQSLATAPGTRPFPEGPDLYRSFDELTGTSVLDGAGALPGPKPVGDVPSPRRPDLDMDDA